MSFEYDRLETGLKHGLRYAQACREVGINIIGAQLHRDYILDLQVDEIADFAELAKTHQVEAKTSASVGYLWVHLDAMVEDNVQISWCSILNDRFPHDEVLALLEPLHGEGSDA